MRLMLIVVRSKLKNIERKQLSLSRMQVMRLKRSFQSQRDGLDEDQMPFGIVCSPEWKDGVRKLAMQYLNTSCMLTQQKDKLLVEKVVRKVQWPDLVPYEGGWAVCDILVQFLQNRSGKEREMEKDMQSSKNSALSQDLKKQQRKGKGSNDRGKDEASSSTHHHKTRKAQASTNHQQSKRKAKDGSDLDSCDPDSDVDMDNSDLDSADSNLESVDSDLNELEANSSTHHHKKKSQPLQDDEGDAENKACTSVNHDKDDNDHPRSLLPWEQDITIIEEKKVPQRTCNGKVVKPSPEMPTAVSKLFEADINVEMEEMEPITGLSDLDSSDDEANDSPGTW
ncbi:hypothetical protein BDN67DRAFT_984425 [Paxillus ammoniavirescens]|nr:hypothetical protein BDN67DRAFT_984425 [Paxillus ammoniavirescens]